MGICKQINNSNSPYVMSFINYSWEKLRDFVDAMFPTLSVPSHRPGFDASSSSVLIASGVVEGLKLCDHVPHTKLLHMSMHMSVPQFVHRCHWTCPTMWLLPVIPPLHHVLVCVCVCVCVCDSHPSSYPDSHISGFSACGMERREGRVYQYFHRC